MIVLSGVMTVPGQMTMEIHTTLFQVQLKLLKLIFSGILKELQEYQPESSMVKCLPRLDLLTT